jgi:hypothetical protein
VQPKQEQAGGSPIEAVNGHAAQIRILVLVVGQQIPQKIEDCALVTPQTWMYRHSGGLMDGKEMLVAVTNTHRMFLSRYKLHFNAANIDAVTLFDR